MKNLLSCFISVTVLGLFSCKEMPKQGEIWLTDPSKDILFQKQENLLFEPTEELVADIFVDEEIKFQEIEGFGFTLSQGSAMHLLGVDEDKRKELLQELFGEGENDIGISYLRLSIAASDLNETVFSYHDLEEGESDPELEKFDLGPDRDDVIPILKEILAINPKITLMGSPWSPRLG